MALTSPTSGGRSVGTVRLWTQAMEFSFLYNEPSVSLNIWKFLDHPSDYQFLKKHISP
jgi:hypothetical protein